MRSTDVPRGTRHVVTGRLLGPRRDLLLVLEVDGGGEWVLDAPPGASKLVGHRVTVEGARSGFNLLDVDRIDRV